MNIYLSLLLLLLYEYLLISSLLNLLVNMGFKLNVGKENQKNFESCREMHRCLKGKAYTDTV
jgi:hypothetical protein